MNSLLLNKELIVSSLALLTLLLTGFVVEGCTAKKEAKPEYISQPSKPAEKGYTPAKKCSAPKPKPGAHIEIINGFDGRNYDFDIGRMPLTKDRVTDIEMSIEDDDEIIISYLYHVNEIYSSYREWVHFVSFDKNGVIIDDSCEDVNVEGLNIGAVVKSEVKIYAPVNEVDKILITTEHQKDLKPFLNPSVGEPDKKRLYILPDGTPIALDDPFSEKHDTEAKGTYITVVEPAGVNVRSGPGTSYGTLGQVECNTKLEKLDYENGWYKVRTLGGTVGWVCEGMDGDIYVK